MLALRKFRRAIPQIQDGDLPAPQEISGELSIRNLHFSWGDSEVLRGISFDVPAHGSVAIVGKTGSESPP